MKKLIAMVVACTFLLLGCGNGQNQASNEPIVAGTDYDVIVVGGEPEGVAAAVSAARNGMQTLLIEDDQALGGLMTLGMLNFLDMCHGRDGTLLTQGIFEEFHDAVGGTAFDVEVAKATFLKMVTDEPRATLKLNASLIKPLMEDNVVVGVVVEENGEEKTYRAARVIDATVDADLAAAAGVPYTFAGEDIGEQDRMMGVTLVFELSGVEWDEIFHYLTTDDDEQTGADNKSAWGYKEGYDYVPQDPMMKMRGFNIARQDNGNVLINALIIFGVDVLDPASRAEGIARAQTELAYIVPYINEHFVGFEQAKLVGTAEQLYVRESRHIIGEYQLSIDDVLENRDQWDKIAIGSYPVDIQPTATQRYGTVVGSPDRYGIPFRCLVPLEIENLLVVGRSASYHSLAAGSARVMPIGMAEGEAAGVAASYSVREEMSFREMSQSKTAIGAIQKTLKKQGAYLEDFNLPEPVMDHWAYEGLKTLRSLGLLDGSYSNDYHLDEPMSQGRYQNMMTKCMQKAGHDLQTQVAVGETPLNQEIVGQMAYFAGYEQEGYLEQVAYLKEKGIMTKELETYFTDASKNPEAAEVIMLMANLYHYLTE